MRPTKRYARDLLPVDRIASEAVRLKGGGLRAVLECPTLAFGIKGEAEQRAIVDGWATLLNSLSHPLQIVIRSRKVDPAIGEVNCRCSLPKLTTSSSRSGSAIG